MNESATELEHSQVRTTAHSWATDRVLRALEVDPQRGLSAAEAHRRLAAHGPNRLRSTRAKPWWHILLDQFKGLVVILLLVAAVIAAAFGQFVEAIAIAAALVINAAIGFVTELRARQSVEALKRLGRATATVRRDGRERELPAERLVPGDIVLLAEGAMVPADLRLTVLENLQTDESALTGESVPVTKHDASLEDVRTPLAERSNMAFRGTAVARGTGEGVVVATGMGTEIGRISELVHEAAEAATPLERRLESLGRRLIYLVIAVGIAVAVSGIVAGKPLLVMIETAIVLAIAAVPEGLPIVSTVALGRGMWRMARRNALVKHLAAVETLGATTVIFSDKTGTLTENRMVLRRVALPEGDVDLERRGEETDFVDQHGSALQPARDAALQRALRVCVLCSNAERRDDGGADGDPTEVALVQAGAAAGLERETLLQSLPEEREESFDAATKMMATVHTGDEGFWFAVKGAPEAVLGVCNRVQTPDAGSAPLDEDARRAWAERHQALAREGLRVLAVAEKTAASAEEPPYSDLTLLGLVGLYDPPRAAVKDAIAACRTAGIRVVMVTGDHPATAANIAGAIGVVGESDAAVMTGRELDARGDLGEIADDEDAIWRCSVFARVSPEQKLRLIEVYRDKGEVVGMTGDGVNDAPALKKADIGIAMGRRGTEVARETADIVLKDDAFETIVAAIEQGRAIFENIRKFIVFLLSGNLGQILGVSAAALVNAPLPLLPLQILFLNLLLDVFPALAIGVSRGSRDAMQYPPRDPAEPILTRAHWQAIAGFGALMAATLLAVLAWALLGLGLSTATAVTMTFLTYGLARLWHTFNMRSIGTHALVNNLTRNPYIWGAIVGCGALLVATVYVPPVRSLLELTLLGAREWAIVVGASLVPLVLGQLGIQAVGRWRRREAAWRPSEIIRTSDSGH